MRTHHIPVLVPFGAYDAAGVRGRARQSCIVLVDESSHALMCCPFLCAPGRYLPRASLLLPSDTMEYQTAGFPLYRHGQLPCTRDIQNSPLPPPHKVAAPGTNLASPRLPLFQYGGRRREEGAHFLQEVYVQVGQGTSRTPLARSSDLALRLAGAWTWTSSWT